MSALETLIITKPEEFCFLKKFTEASKMGMTPLWILDLASALSLAMAAWSEAEKEKLESLREWLRNVCLTCGLNKSTDSLGHLWCMITVAQVKLHGCAGNDIGTDSMGVPCAQRPFASLLKMNIYQLHYFKLDMKNAKEMLLKLKSCDPCDLAMLEDVEQICTEIEDVLQDSSFK